MIGIYMIKNKINNMVYIGESMDIERRWEEHIAKLSNNSHHSWKFQSDWNRYGENCFEFGVIKEIKSFKNQTVCKSYIVILEDVFIKKYNSISEGYNVERTYDKIINKEKSIFKDSYNDVLYNAFMRVDNKVKLFMSKDDFDGMEACHFITTYMGETSCDKLKSTRQIIKKIIKYIGSKSNINKNFGDIDEIKEGYFYIDNNKVYITNKYVKKMKEKWISDNF